MRDQWHTMTRTRQRRAARRPQPRAVRAGASARRGALRRRARATSRRSQRRAGACVVRVEVTDRRARRAACSCRCTGAAQFASGARVGALIAAVSRPGLGPAGAQARARAPPPLRTGVAWLRAVRAPLARADCTYLARARGPGFLALRARGRALPASWPEWAERAARSARGARRALRLRPAAAIAARASPTAGCRRACSSRRPRRCRRARWLGGLVRRRTRSTTPSRRDPRGPPGEAGGRVRADRVLVLLGGPLDAAARDPHARARHRRANRQGAARRHELRLVRAGAQGATRGGRSRARVAAGRMGRTRYTAAASRTSWSASCTAVVQNPSREGSSSVKSSRR